MGALLEGERRSARRVRRALLVATPGGHIDELVDLAPRIVGLGGDRVWVTSHTPQTTGLLTGEQVAWVGRIGPREGRKALARIPRAIALLERYRADLVISTGAAMAVPYLAAASLLGIEAHFIESATRRDGPSLSGRLVSRLPNILLHQQSFQTGLSRWHPVGSVFDGYASGSEQCSALSSVVVILGTERFAFRRLLDQVRATFSPGTKVVVQSGHTPPVEGLDCRPWLSFAQLQEALDSADVVITHAGVGSVLGALRAGKHPIVVPRCSRLGEHIDDHQVELAGMLRQRGLASIVEPTDHLRDVLPMALQRTTVRVSSPPIQLLRPARPSLSWVTALGAGSQLAPVSSGQVG